MSWPAALEVLRLIVIIIAIAGTAGLAVRIHEKWGRTPQPAAPVEPAPEPEPRRIIVHGGYVISRSDGDEHWVSASRVARLHNLPPGTWFHGDDVRGRGKLDNDLHLYPRPDGRYDDHRQEF